MLGNFPRLRSSFLFKLFLLFTLLTAVMTFVFTAFYSVSELNKSRTQASQVLDLQARSFAETLRLPLYAEDREKLEQAAREILTLPEIRAVEIASADGRTLVRSPSPFPSEADRLLSRSATVHPAATIRSLSSGVDVAGTNQQVIGGVTLYRTTEDLTDESYRLLLTAICFGFLFWLLVSISCYRLLQRVTRSFQHLMQGLERIHAGDYDTAARPILSDDEPGRALAAVNDLAETLKRRQQENAALTTELRTAMEDEIATKEELVRVNSDLEREIAASTSARQELKQLVERLPVGIVWSDADGSLEYMNSFMLARFGYQPGEMVSIEQWFFNMVPDPVERARVLELRRLAAMEAYRKAPVMPGFYDLHAVSREGCTRHLNMGVQLSGYRVIDIIIDMTEREHLQQQIIRNQKLESIGVLAGGIAHNFNNALTGVLGFISFAREFLAPGHSSYEPLARAERASLRAAEMARQLLTYAKEGPPVRGIVEVEKVVQEAVLMATVGSRVAICTKLPPDLHRLFVDEGQISQAFNCLCINAVQSMREGGILTVRGRNVISSEETLPVPAPGRYVELCFEDQGCGIPEADQGKIFTPYFTTKAEVGTGLGLATVHAIVTRHGGAITFVSRVGTGTAFTVYLPVAEESEPTNAPPELKAATLPQGGRGRSVLVLDDEEMIRALVREVLENNGYQVILCANGDEATFLYHEAFKTGGRPLAAILDLTVAGGIGGTEVAQRVLAFDPEARLVVSSGHTEDEVMTRYREYGFCAAAKKPYRSDELLHLLYELQGSG